MAQLVRNPLRRLGGQRRLLPARVGAAAEPDSGVPRRAVRQQRAAGGAGRRRRHPVGAQQLHGAAAGGRHLLRLRGGARRPGLLRRELHPRVELRLRDAVPVPGPGALDARRRLPLQRRPRRRHDLPPATAARARAARLPAVRRRPVRRRDQGLPGVEDQRRLTVAARPLGHHQAEHLVRLGGQQPRPLGRGPRRRAGGSPAPHPGHGAVRPQLLAERILPRCPGGGRRDGRAPRRDRHRGRVPGAVRARQGVDRPEPVQRRVLPAADRPHRPVYPGTVRRRRRQGELPRRAQPGLELLGPRARRDQVPGGGGLRDRPGARAVARQHLRHRRRVRP